jgi:hypothetical protein
LWQPRAVIPYDGKPKPNYVARSPELTKGMNGVRDGHEERDEHTQHNLIQFWFTLDRLNHCTALSHRGTIGIKQSITQLLISNVVGRRFIFGAALPLVAL